jgi:hypothetical protein
VGAVELDWQRRYHRVELLSLSAMRRLATKRSRSQAEMSLRFLQSPSEQVVSHLTLPLLFPGREHAPASRQ